MKFNIVVPILCAILLGYLCASFVFNQYEANSMVFNETGNIYFLQCGAYKTKKASENEIQGIEEKITIKEGENYYSYIGMTSNIEIAKSIQKKYKEKNIDIYIKEGQVENDDFINQIRQYDVLLESSNNFEEINSVLKTILATYDEFVLNS